MKAALLAIFPILLLSSCLLDSDRLEGHCFADEPCAQENNGTNNAANNVNNPNNVNNSNNVNNANNVNNPNNVNNANNVNNPNNVNNSNNVNNVNNSNNVNNANNENNGNNGNNNVDPELERCLGLCGDLGLGCAPPCPRASLTQCQEACQAPDSRAHVLNLGGLSEDAQCASFCVTPKQPCHLVCNRADVACAESCGEENPAELCHEFCDQEGALQDYINALPEDAGDVCPLYCDLGQPIVPQVTVEGERLEGRVIRFVTELPASLDGLPVSWTWSFGDGSAPVGPLEGQQEITHIYEHPGTFTPSLLLSAPGGRVGEWSGELVLGNLVPDLTGLTVAEPGQTFFEGESLDFEATFVADEADALSWSWDFGDGESVTDAGPTLTHAYANPGAYSAKVRLEDDDGSFDELTQELVVLNRPPVISEVTWDTGDEVQTGTEVTFTATAAGAPGDVLTYRWEFRDDNSTQEDEGLSQVRHIFREAGVFFVFLTVSDEDGASVLAEDITMTVRAPYVPPSLQVIARGEPREGEALEFDVLLVGNDWGLMPSFEVDFGDGTVQSFVEQRFEHTYDDNGDYEVEVSAPDPRGGAVALRASTLVEVSNVPPTASLALAPGQSLPLPTGLNIEFEVLAFDPAGENDRLTYEWDFGDGGRVPSGGPTQEHYYTQNGTFNVRVTVEDGDGGMATDNLSVTVQGSADQCVSICQQTYSQCQNLCDPVVLPECIVFGCDDERVRPTIVGVLPNLPPSSKCEFFCVTQGISPRFDFVNEDFTQEEGQAITFEVAPTGAAWDNLVTNNDFDLNSVVLSVDYGDGSPVVQGRFFEPFSHIYQDDGVYTLLVSAPHVDLDGEFITLTGLAFISNAAPRVSLPSGLVATEGETLEVVPTVSDPGALDALTYSWSYGGVGVSAAPGPLRVRLPQGATSLTLTVTDDSRASGSATQTIVVSPSGPCGQGPSGDGALCIPAGTFLSGVDPWEVSLDPYWIDRDEVTVASYVACVQAGACTPRESCSGATAGTAQPVNCVSWEQAQSFCAWKGQVSSQGALLGRLPTEAEWEKAARGEDARLYPWGDSPAPGCDRVVMAEGGQAGCGTLGPLDVGSKPLGDSPYGLRDVLGNVAEWMLDSYASPEDRRAQLPAISPPPFEGGQGVTTRGGHFGTSSGGVSLTARTFSLDGRPNAATGMRCAYTPTPIEMVRVPEGPFARGVSDGQGDERPPATVTLDTFWIDRHEVTQADYDACVLSGACDAPGCGAGGALNQGNPVTCVSWQDARGYCAWVGKRLPTEAEWEKAARGADARLYPWGDTPEPNCDLAVVGAAGEEVCPSLLSSVGSKPGGVSPYGALDMAGNAAEWVYDEYDADAYSSLSLLYPGAWESDPEADERVVRGGAYFEEGYAVSTVNRELGAADSRDLGHVGFRCAWSPAPVEMVHVPAGPFLQGSFEAQEGPARFVEVSSFWIDRAEVSSEEYARCVLAGACAERGAGEDCTRSRDGELPANCVSWGQATAYCAWAGKRLPTEAEWEKAARGVDARLYPWGVTQGPSCGLANLTLACNGGVVPVYALPDGASPYGLLNTLGNVAEWVQDAFRADAYELLPDEDPLLQDDANPTRVVRGGSAFDADHTLARRSSLAFTEAPASVGFRCALGGF